jgi:malate synthase
MHVSISQLVSGVEIKGRMFPEVKEVLTPDAIQFISKLHYLFNRRRVELLEKREKRQEEINSGLMPNFLKETSATKNSGWKVAPLPDDLLDRRVEIIGSVDQKTIVDGLNSGANIFVADFDDSTSPTWNNIIEGQINLKDAVEESISYINTEAGKFYKLNKKISTLMVRPRSWHLVEKNFLINGEPISASLFDFGLFFFHNAKSLIDKGTAPYFYLPKLESRLEAGLWNDVFVFSQDAFGIPLGTIKATVLIDTITAAFEMDEILYELREHSAGLACGKWNYIFSFIKKFRNHPMFIFPDREQITMTSRCMQSYYNLLIKTCHKRNVHAIGCVSTDIPVKDDKIINETIFRKVYSDKDHQARKGFDGTMVVHPGFVTFTKKAFDKYISQKNQLENKKEEVNITTDDLLSLPVGTITLEALKRNIDLGIRYLEGWLRGEGSFPIYDSMENTATVEISRTQVWQAVNNPGGSLEDGMKISEEIYVSLLESQLVEIKNSVGERRFHKGAYHLAAEIFDSLIREKDFTEFLTLRAYEFI